MDIPPPHDGYPLTVGIELEFLIEGQQAETAYNQLARGLRDKTTLPLAMLCWHDLGEGCDACRGITREQIDIVTRDNKGVLSPVLPNHLGPGNIDPFQYFHIKEESISRQVIGALKSWQAVEITTPILSSADVSAGLPQLAELVGGLRTIEQAVGLNVDCGLHVHLGYADGMTLLRAKRVLTLILILEEALLELLVSPERRATQQAQWTTRRSFIYSYRRWVEDTDPHLVEGAVEDDVFRAHVGGAVFEEALVRCFGGGDSPRRLGLFWALVRTWACDSLVHLDRLMMRAEGGRSQAALCLRCGDDLDMLDGAIPSPSTFEFRHLQMTTDPKLMANWAGILSAIMRAGLEEADAFQVLFHRLLFSMDMSRDVGMDA